MLTGLKLANKLYDDYTSSMQRGHQNYILNAKKLENTYLGAGRHWDEEDKAQLDAEGKPALEINLVYSTIQSLLGFQTQSRMNIAYQPRETGDQEVSEILTKISLYELDKNKFPWIESQVFSDGIIQQRGYFDIRMDYEKDLNGQIKVEALDPMDVIPDPDAKSYDPNDWKKVMVTKWLPLEEIKILYPKKYRQVMNTSDHDSDWGDDEWGIERNKFGDSYTSKPYHTDKYGEKYIRVLDTQYRKVVRRDYFYDSEADELIPVPDSMTQKEAKREAKKLGMEIITRVTNRIRWTVSTRDVILHDDWSPYEHFTVVPFFPVFRRGQTLGLVDNLVSIQDSLDKVWSQVLHVINTTANSGWIVEENSLTNMDTEDLEDHGAKTGLVVEYKRGYTPPQKIEPNKIPTGLMEFLNSTVGFIKMVGIVSDAFQGQKGNEVSGQAIQQRVAQTAIGLSAMIDNLLYTRNLVATVILNLIQNFYTEERTFRIISDRDTQKEADEEIAINQPETMMDDTGEVVERIVNDVTVGKYDVVISDVPTQVNYQQGQLQEALEFRKYGVGIPDDEMVKLSTLTRKNEIAKRLSGEANEAQQQQMQMQMEQLRAQISEINSKVESNTADAQKKIAEVAQIIAEQPQTAAIMDQLEQEENTTEQQQLGQTLY